MRVLLKEGEEIILEVGNFRFKHSENCAVISRWSGKNWIDIITITGERFQVISPEKLHSFFERDSSREHHNTRKHTKTRPRASRKAKNTKGAA